ncbi:Gfo/Idh/MocA-like oxidoreductase N-terminal domain-containing protein [[Candida] zeylanoides]
MSPLNVGIIGTGIFATDTHLPTFAQVDGITPAACFNRTRSKAEAFAARANIPAASVYDSLEAIFAAPEVDFVDALLPVQHNVDAVNLAIAHGKPLAFEKPIAANLEQARQIVRLSAESSIPIAVLENWSFRNAIGVLTDKVLPQIGDVVSFTYHSTGPWNDNNKYLATAWRQNPEHIGGFLSDGGVHQLALLTDVLGPVATVSGLTRQVRPESGADDVLFSTMALKSGVIGTFTYGSAFGATAKSTSFTVYGTNGSAVYDFSPSLPQPTITWQTGTGSASASEPHVLAVEETSTFVAEFENFAAAVRSGDKSAIRVPPAKAFHHLAIVAAALESSASGGTAVKVAST